MEIYAYKHPDDPLKQLNVDIAELQHGEKSKERAVLELALQLGLGISEIQDREAGMSEDEATSAVLRNEKLSLTEDNLEIQQILKEAYRKKIYRPSVGKVTKEKPTALWYLVPFFFSIIGGLIGYAGVKNEDRDMAANLLYFGVFMLFVYLAIGWLYYNWLLSLL